MDIDRRSNFGEDGMMECQSFGSNYHPSSQSRKVSIGVLIDSIANSKAKNIKEQEAEKLTSTKGNCIEDGIKSNGFAPIVEKQGVASEQDISSWVSIRSFNQKIPTSVTVKDAEHTPSFPSTSKRCNRSKVSKTVSAVHSVQVFGSKTTAIESDEVNNKKFGKATYTRKSGEMGNAEHVNNLAFVTEPEVLPDKGHKTNKSEMGGTECQDGMMECQSFGSNYHTSSQSRKVSIGVLIDSIANSKAKNIKEQEAEKLTSTKGNCIEDGINSNGFTPIVEKHVVASEQDISSWVSIRSFNQKIPTSVTVKDAEHTPSFPSTSKRRNRSKVSKTVSAVHSVQVFGSKMTAIESDEVNKKKFGKATYTRKSGEMGNAERVNNLAFVTEPEVLPDKGDKTDKSEMGGTEALRTKLWEILGNVSSPNKECPSVLPVNTGTKDSHPNHESNRKGSPAGKLRQNSDTIESDSERSDHAARRTLTHSSIRKKSPTKMQSCKTGTSIFTSYGKEYAEKSVFSFSGERSGKLYDTANGRSLPSKRKKSERESFGVGTNQMCFHECENSEERQQSENKRKSIPAAQILTSAGNNITTNNISQDERNGVYVKPISGNKKKFTDESLLNITSEQFRDVVESPEMKEKDFARSMLKNRMDPILDPQSPTFEIKSPILSSSLGSPSKSNQGKHHDQSPSERIYCTRDIQSFKSLLHSKSTQYKSNAQPELSDERNGVYVKPISGNKKKFTDESLLNITSEQFRDVVESPEMKEKDFARSMLKNRMDPILDPQSPTFEIESPILSSSLGSPSKSNQGKHHDQSPSERIYCTRDIQSFKSLLHSKSTQYKSNAQPELSDDSGEIKDSPIMKSRLSLEDVENRMSTSSSDEMDSESSEENLNIKGCRESELFFPEIGSANRQEFVSLQSEWLGHQEGVKLTGFSPASKSFKGTEKSSKLQAHLYQEDSAIALIAMALDRVKTKMKSATSKKAAKILRSAAEGIHLQLQSAESQIKTDLGKLTSLSESKRTSVETRFEEQQEHLHGTYKRFKEEIDRHLVDYKSLIEDLEERNIELKGTMNKQRTVHNRILLQGQQAIDVQVKDAQKRITAVHDRAKEKMLQLKLVIEECIKEGAFS